MAIYRAVFSGLIYGQLWQNRVHFRKNEGGPTVEQFATHLNLNWVEKMRNTQHGLVQWLSIQVVDISGGSGLGHTLAISKTGAQGQESQDTSFECGVIKLGTGFAGKRNRGRIYMAGIRGGATQFGLIQAFEIDNWNNRLAELAPLYLGNASSGCNLIIHNGPESPDREVTTWQMRQILGVQRRRNIGVGA